MKVRRFGVSLEEDLLEKLDRLSAKHKFPNRSQAIRFLIRSALVEEARSEDLSLIHISEPTRPY